jgi:hypothetical protein
LSRPGAAERFARARRHRASPFTHRPPRLPTAKVPVMPPERGPGQDARNGGIRSVMCLCGDGKGEGWWRTSSGGVVAGHGMAWVRPVLAGSLGSVGHLWLSFWRWVRTFAGGVACAGADIGSEFMAGCFARIRC